MASYINTNFTSLQAQNNLSASQSNLQTSIQRLSSGLRINSAKDDAAGLAISDRMTSQINGLNQAGLNANNGISLAQTADGALASVSSDLQRIRQLAVESANGTNSASDRQSLNQESTQLLSEINRVSSSTQFNGLNLLDGSFTGAQFQVGANANQTISVSLQGASTTSLGSYGGQGSTVSNVAFGASGNFMTIGSNYSSSPVTIGASVGSDATHGLTDSSAAAKAAAINAQTSNTGVTATATTSLTESSGPTTSAISIAAGTITLNGVSLGAVSGSGAVASGQSFAAAVNAVSAQTGVTATADGGTGALTLKAADGRDIQLGSSTAGVLGTDLGIQADGTAVTTAGYGGSTTAESATISGTITLNSASSFSLGGQQALAEAGLSTTGSTSAGLVDGTTGTAATYTAGLTTLSTVDLTTADKANTALGVIDAAISQIDSQRAVLGATSNRFQATVSNLSQTSANLASSRSRIQDTDYATETANLSQAQILQQAGTAMLTQANSLPNSVLTLLKG